MFKGSDSIIIIGQRDADHVMIEPLSKVVSGWRTTNIAAHCGVWAGHYTGQFLLGELTKFGKELECFCQNLKPKATLNSVEHYLQLTLIDDGHGRVHLESQARDRLGAKTTLEFELEVDRGTWRR